MVGSKEKRQKFLKTAYKISGGSTSTWMSLEDISDNLNLGLAELEDLYHTLSDFGYVEGKSLGGDFGITSQGIREAEDLLENDSDGSSKSGGDSNQINIGKIEGDFKGQMQQGGEGNTQNVNFGNVDYRKIEQEILPEMKELIRSPMYQMGEDFRYNVEVIEEQIDSDSPDDGKLREALKSAKKILEDTASTALASQIPQLIEKIGLIL